MRRLARSASSSATAILSDSASGGMGGGAQGGGFLAGVLRPEFLGDELSGADCGAQTPTQHRSCSRLYFWSRRARALRCPPWRRQDRVVAQPARDRGLQNAGNSSARVRRRYRTARCKRVCRFPVDDCRSVRLFPGHRDDDGAAAFAQSGERPTRYPLTDDDIGFPDIEI